MAHTPSIQNLSVTEYSSIRNGKRAPRRLVALPVHSLQGCTNLLRRLTLTCCNPPVLPLILPISMEEIRCHHGMERSSLDSRLRLSQHISTRGAERQHVHCTILPRIHGAAIVRCDGVLHSWPVSRSALSVFFSSLLTSTSPDFLPTCRTTPLCNRTV